MNFIENFMVSRLPNVPEKTIDNSDHNFPLFWASTRVDSKIDNIFYCLKL